MSLASFHDGPRVCVESWSRVNRVLNNAIMTGEEQREPQVILVRVIGKVKTPLSGDCEPMCVRVCRYSADW